MYLPRSWRRITEIRYVIPTSPSSEHVRFCHLRSDYFDAPDVIGPAGRHAPQQIGRDGGGLGPLGQVRSGINRRQAHLAHVAGDRFVIDHLAVGVQLGGAAPHALEGMGGVDFVNAPLERHLGGRGRQRAIVETAAIEAEQVDLPAQRQIRRRVV
jgi:hypothetical protein